MRLTVRLKLFMIMSALILLFAILSQLLCAFFLESYYHSSKEKDLYNCLTAVNMILRGDNDMIQSELLTLERNSYMSIILTDANYEIAFSMTPTFGVAMRSVPIIVEPRTNEDGEVDNTDEYHVMPPDSFMPSIQKKHPNEPPDVQSHDPVVDEQISILITETESEQAELQFRQNVAIERYPETLLRNWINEYTGKPLIKDFNLTPDGRGFIGLMSAIELPDGSPGYAMIQTSIVAMESSVKAASRFIMYISLGIFLVSIPAIFLASRSISKPIVRMSEIARNMSNLDLSEKLVVKSSDEIGELAQNVNRMSDELDRTITELNNNLELKDKIEEFRKEFIANVSHELKTPISLIGGYAEGLRFNIAECDKDYYCGVIIDESRKMNELVRSLLDLSQMEFGSTPMNKEYFDLSDLTSAVLSRFELIFERKRIIVDCELAGNCSILADSLRIEQVIINFLTNAVNHVYESGRICIRVSEPNGRAKLSVYNDGKHLDEENLERIWHSFYKADEARTRDYGGQGLGLSIVRAIVEAHGGRCGAVNQENGVEFWFEV